jgi:hypothetical protein
MPAGRRSAESGELVTDVAESDRLGGLGRVDLGRPNVESDMLVRGGFAQDGLGVGGPEREEVDQKELLRVELEVDGLGWYVLKGKEVDVLGGDG